LPSETLRRHRFDTARTLEEYIDTSLKKGWIRESKSLVVLNILIAGKKDDIKGRPYIDLRRINNITISDKYPLLNT
jgi:hypothetical protein